MVGKFFSFDPKGTYFPVTADDKALKPSLINLAALDVHSGDYIGLRGSGSWSPGKDLPPIQRMSGVFRKSGGAFLKPAASGQESRFDNWAPPGGQSNDIDQDFNVSYDKETIVRVPDGAKEIALNSGDWHFDDNSATGADCGVLVTLPNRKRPDPSIKLDAANLDGILDEVQLDPQHLMSAFAGFLSAAPPEAKAFTESPFALKAGKDAFPQWRSQYWNGGGGGWSPNWSQFHAAPPPRKHMGWDIFSPVGSALVAPVGPAIINLLPNVRGYGNIITFQYSLRNVVHTLFYSHVSSMVGLGGRIVQVGEFAGYSGASGNAGTEGSGAQHGGEQCRNGGRTDHVHVGLMDGVVGPNPTVVIDPGGALGWAIRFADNFP